MDALVKSGFGARVHAWLMSHAGPGYDRLVGERKRSLFAGLAGSILEIGPGTGVNLKYFAKSVNWIGVEPNPYMNPHLHSAMRACGLRAEIRQGLAERLPAEEASQDAVVSTLVLCSVGEPQRVMSEIRRVLKPGGRFIFIEHVAAPEGTVLRALQRWVQPAWGCVADGCQANRETWKLIEAAGFSEVRIEHFRLPLALVSPQIAGVAIR